MRRQVDTEWLISKTAKGRLEKDSHGERVVILHDPDDPCSRADPETGVIMTRSEIDSEAGERALRVSPCDFCGENR